MEYIVGFVLLLGVLVFIHEFGHFIVAKAFKVRVETFSIGMGKKLITFKRGETEYAISLFPLGGYVKLTGQDPREEVPPELESRSFRNKPLYARAAVVLAGPVFNLILAILVFTYLFLVGMPSPGAVVERLLPNSPAALAGFQAGDRIVAIESAKNGRQKILELSDLERVVGRSAGQDLLFQVARKNGEETSFHYTPELGQDRDSTIGVLSERGVLKGVERNAVATTLLVMPSSWAQTRSLASPFLVTSVSFDKDGSTQTIATQNFNELESAWSQAVQSQGDAGKIVFTGHSVFFEKDDAGKKKEKTKPTAEDLQEKTFTLAWTDVKDRPADSLEGAGMVSSELVLADILAKSPAEKLGLLEGDILTHLNSEKIQSFNSFRENLQKAASSGNPVKLEWIRYEQVGTNWIAVPKASEITPELAIATDALTEAKKNQFQIGATFRAWPAPPTMVLVKADSLFEAIQLGTDRSFRLTGSMLDSFYHLAKGDISPKTLGGPILIAKISGESFKQGSVAFLRMMAFISLNLFLLNLFPIPVLDGGHLLMYIIEAIRRRPLSIKFIEYWSTAGFVLLMSLIAVVMFNDIARLIKS